MMNKQCWILLASLLALNTALASEDVPACGINGATEEENIADCRAKFGDNANVCTIEDIVQTKSIPCKSFELFAANNFTVRESILVSYNPPAVIGWKPVRTSFGQGEQWNSTKNLLNWLPQKNCDGVENCRQIHDGDGFLKRSKICYIRWNEGSQNRRRIPCSDLSMAMMVGLAANTFTLYHQEDNGIQEWRDDETQLHWRGPQKDIGGLGGLFNAKSACKDLPGTYSQVPSCQLLQTALKNGLVYLLATENPKGLNLWCETPGGPMAVSVKGLNYSLSYTDPIFQSNDLICVSKGVSK